MPVAKMCQTGRDLLCYKKTRVHELKKHCVKIDYSLIYEEWLGLGTELRKEYELQSDFWIKRSTFLLKR